MMKVTSQLEHQQVTVNGECFDLSFARNNYEDFLQVFSRTHYPDLVLREELAGRIGLSESCVQVCRVQVGRVQVCCVQVC